MNHEFAYRTQSGFLGGSPDTQALPYAVAGVAFDGGTTNRPGARFGPQAIRQASQMLCDAEHDLWGCSPLGLVADYGDLLTPNTNLSAMRAVLEQLAEPIARRHHVCWLGGDHSITLSLLRVYRRLCGQPLALVHFDAHCDTWTSHCGEPSGHGTWVYEALSENLIVPEATIQIGLRSPGPRAARDYVRQVGGCIFDARSLRGQEDPGLLANVVDEVRRRVEAARRPPVYVSLDIDCLDPGFAPGTGTPEPAGLTTTQVATLLEKLVGLPCIAMDCVEVSPPYDYAQLTSQAAAYFVWTYLCARIASGDSWQAFASESGATSVQAGVAG